MPAIVADTSPLNYLILIEATEILSQLYQQVLIPPGVRAELAHPNAPSVVRQWIQNSQRG